MKMRFTCTKGFTHRLKFSVIPKGGEFTLVEMLVVVAIIGVLASIVLASLNTSRAKGRDARRVSDMHEITNALSLYYSANGSYPPINAESAGVGGWNVSYNPGFLQALVPDFMGANPKDPINQLESGFSFFGAKAGSYFYAYYNYPDASAYGCSFSGSFAVIAVRQLEGGITPTTSRATCGTFPPGGCPDGGISGVCRDWGTEFDYSAIWAP